MKRFRCFVRLVLKFFGCKGRQYPDFEEGYCERDASLDGARFFISLESRDSRFLSSIPEVLTCPGRMR
ncbi:MAG: hypothetical protein WDA14_11430 [Sphaerochaetaceae bacterium]|jgi:hypothetical protein|nr:hypothetical protein [Sphaerochaetaceae bacterium]MDD4258935.1 hypothetical protein [Sphaerochaetaceae bacterium]MDD4840694.1 hypothetical protein [Sphaerochaetaceae bacterium]NLO61146.1 hypothetical protein [Spirochaetales bacterium]